MLRTFSAGAADEGRHVAVTACAADSAVCSQLTVTAILTRARRTSHAHQRRLV